MSADILKLGTLAILAGIFIYSLRRGWEGAYLIFGMVLLLGSCSVLGI